MIPTTPAQDRSRPCSCPNLACARFNRPGAGNLAHRSWTGKHQQMQRLRCTVCSRACSEREGPLMARCQWPEETVERVLTCQRWGVCDAGTADLGGVDIKTVHRCQPVAAQRAQAHHAQVTHDLRVEAVQLDERPSQRRRPHVEWRQTALAIGSRVVRWGHWGLRTQESAALLVAQVVARLCGVPVWLSDGWKAYPAALVHVLGRVSQRRRRGTRGRHPKPRLLPPRDLCSGQVVQGRDGTGKLLHVVSRVVDGGPRRFVTEMAGRGLRPSLHTAFMERWYGTLRGVCAPWRRRTRGRSSSQRRHQARVWWVVDLDNFVLPHKRWRQQGRPRPPAMAIGLAQHVWSDRDDSGSPVHPDPLGRQLMQQRGKDLLIPALEAG